LLHKRSCSFKGFHRPVSADSSFCVVSMANPQKENGYTQVANEILEHLYQPGINGSELKMLLFIVRKTYGYQKRNDIIPLTQFEKGLNAKRSNVVKTIKSLVKKRLLHKKESRYMLNKNWEEWVVVKRLPPHSSQLTTKTSSQTHNEVVVKRLHSKEVYQKKKENGFYKINNGLKHIRETLNEDSGK